MKRNLSLLDNIIFIIICLTSFKSHAQVNIQFKSNLPFLGNRELSSIWGYSDTIRNKEYAIVGVKYGTSIVDISNPTTPIQVAFINGSVGGAPTWREMKTYSHYAYIVHDQNSLNEGLQIVDLQYLPDSVKTYNIKTLTQGSNTITFNLQHTCFIDDSGFLYINGGRLQNQINGVSYNGTIIFDLKPNPLQPTYVGKASIRYVHDCFVRGNLLFQAHTNSPNSNKFTIWNIQDRSNPILLQDFQTPYGITHNTWLSDDSKTLFVTHEQLNLPMEAYDISDLNNIHQICEFKIMPGNQEIAHNVHVINDFIVVPYYSEGVAIFDASDPTNVITVGYYDTHPGNATLYSGTWGAYPYFKSGNIILSDMTLGLFVLKPTYVRAARIQGTVTDTNTTQPIVSAAFSFVDTAITTSTSIDGFYKTGTVKPGLTRFRVQKTGYIPKYIDTVLVNGVTLNINVQLRQIPVTSSQNVRLCNGSSYRLPDGRIVSAAGTYTSDLVLPSGRDSIITTNLTVAYTTSSIQTTICDGEAYTLPGGRIVTTGGTYIDTLLNFLRCDSLITTQLTVLPTYSFTKYDTINNGEIYTLPNGNTTGIQGSYVNNLTTSSGCDSVVTVNLFVNNVSGIRNTINDNVVKFFVNHNQLLIENSSNTIITQLDIYNSIGVLVQSFVKPNNILVLQTLPKDLYIIRATTNNNEQRVGKVVIY